MKRVISIFVKNLASGGAEKQAVLLARTLCKDFEVHFIIFNASKVHQKYLDMLHDNAQITVVGFKGGHIARFFEFVSYLKIHKIEIVFSYLTSANMYACIASLFAKVSVATGIRNAELPFLKRLADKFLTNYFASLTIVNCYSGKENFCQHGFKAEKIHVIPNCFENIIEYKPKALKSCPTIITVGRFVPQKDYETAIKTISLLKEKNVSFRFVIIGYGELESSIRQWINKYNVEDRVEIFLNPDNISEYLDNADIYLSTSLFEGTSNSIMEGMNADLPIVCTNVGDNAFLVRNGKNGFLTDIQDAEALANSLEILLKDDSMRTRMGMDSKRHLKENYSCEIFRERYSKVITELGR